MKPYVSLFALICVLSAFVGVAYSADEKEKAATDAATQWLALVDSGQYAESWFQASSASGEASSKEQWKNALDTARAPLGKVESRQLKSATYTTKHSQRSGWRVRDPPVRDQLRARSGHDRNRDANAGEGWQVEGVGLLRQTCWAISKC